MFIYLFFSISLIGIFSVIENVKGGQRVSFLKANLLLLLLFISFGSFSYFLDELGCNADLAISLFRLIGTICFVNVFFIIAINKIPKPVIFVECLLFCIYIFMFASGHFFPTAKDGMINVSSKHFRQLNYFITNPLIFASLLYCLMSIRSRADRKNLYHVKVLNWSNYLLFLIVFILSVAILNFLAYHRIFTSYNVDTRPVLIGVYFVLLFFILLRPRFIDEVDFSYPKLLISSTRPNISQRDFEFLFYANFYYLQKDANLEDFSLRLNQDKSAVSEYINNHVNESFNSLVNRNRIKYFRSLLDTKKYESFTLEALSEMSGFNNRQSMYNAFNKYVGGTPSAYINNLNL